MIPHHNSIDYQIQRVNYLSNHLVNSKGDRENKIWLINPASSRMSQRHGSTETQPSRVDLSVLSSLRIYELSNSIKQPSQRLKLLRKYVTAALANLYFYLVFSSVLLTSCNICILKGCVNVYISYNIQCYNSL